MEWIIFKAVAILNWIKSSAYRYNLRGRGYIE